MRKLHLVGFTSDRKGLIFSARRGSKSGGFLVPIEDGLLESLAAEQRRRDGVETGGPTDTETAGGAGEPEPSGRPQSTLTPREMQARLRAGRTIAEVAAEAGVSTDWVERFAIPILAEQAQMVELARSLTYVKSRSGESALPLGPSVAENLAERGVVLPDDMFDAAWSAFQLHDVVWIVRVRYKSRGRFQEAAWEVDVTNGQLTSRNRLASELGYVEKGRRRKARLPAPSTPPELEAQPEHAGGGPPTPARARPRSRSKTVKRTVKRTSGPRAAAAPAKATTARGAATSSATSARGGASASAPTRGAAGRRPPARAGASSSPAAPAKRAPAKRAAKRAPAKRAPAKRVPAKRAPAKRAPAKGAAKRARAAGAPVTRAPARTSAATTTGSKRLGASRPAAKAAASKAPPTKASLTKATAARRPPAREAPGAGPQVNGPVAGRPAEQQSPDEGMRRRPRAKQSPVRKTAPKGTATAPASASAAPARRLPTSRSSHRAARLTGPVPAEGPSSAADAVPRPRVGTDGSPPPSPSGRVGAHGTTAQPRAWRDPAPSSAETARRAPNRLASSRMAASRAAAGRLSGDRRAANPVPAPEPGPTPPTPGRTRTIGLRPTTDGRGGAIPGTPPPVAARTPSRGPSPSASAVAMPPPPADSMAANPRPAVTGGTHAPVDETPEPRAERTTRPMVDSDIFEIDDLLEPTGPESGARPVIVAERVGRAGAPGRPPRRPAGSGPLSPWPVGTG